MQALDRCNKRLCRFGHVKRPRESLPCQCCFVCRREFQNSIIYSPSSKKFPRVELRKDENPDEIVAKGAALQAARNHVLKCIPL